MSVYRDDLGALRMQARQRVDTLTRTEETLDALFWETLSPADTASLASLRKTLKRPPDGMDREGLVALLAAIDGAERIVYGALERLPAVELEWSTPRSLPSGLPSYADRPWAGGMYISAHYETLAAEWGALLRAFDRGASWERADDGLSWRGVLRSEGVGLCVLWEPFARNAHNNAEDYVTVGASMPRATAKLRVRPRGWSDDLLGVVGIGGRKIHDDRFDGYFVVEATPEASAALLPDEVKRGLLEVAQEDVPQAEVGQSLALVRWTYAPSHRSFAGAVHALVAWHRVGPTRRFRK